MKQFRLLLGLLAATVILGFGHTTIAQTGNVSVSVVDSSFAPQTITVPIGGTVVWQNNGTMMHTVTADNGSFNSGTLAPGMTFSHNFSMAGTFPYHCQFHGAAGGIGMSGTVIVTSSAQRTPSNTPVPSTPPTNPSTSPSMPMPPIQYVAPGTNQVSPTSPYPSSPQPATCSVAPSTGRQGYGISAPRRWFIGFSNGFHRFRLYLSRVT